MAYGLMFHVGSGCVTSACHWPDPGDRTPRENELTEQQIKQHLSPDTLYYRKVIRVFE